MLEKLPDIGFVPPDGLIRINEKFPERRLLELEVMFNVPDIPSKTRPVSSINWNEFSWLIIGCILYWPTLNDDKLKDSFRLILKRKPELGLTKIWYVVGLLLYW